MVLALVVALVGPYFVDWTGYRTDFEREASRVLGRPVAVRGDVTARLLPFPSVSFTDVEVQGEKPGEPAMTADEFSMDAELAPFLRGQFFIFDMRLVRPSVVLKVGEDGRVDWAARPSTPFDAGHIRVEKLTVTQGRARLLHAPSGREHLLTEIDADISARTLAGPWRLEGTLRADGVRTAVSLTTGEADGSGGMRVRMTATPDPYPVMLETDGEVRIADGVARYEGRFRFEARTSPRGNRVNGSTPAPGRPAPPEFRFNGRFAADHGRIDVPEFRFETGPADNPYGADGTARLDLGSDPRFMIQAQGQQVLLDEVEGQSAGLALDQRLAALRGALENLPRPSIAGTVDVRLPAVVAGDTTLRNIALTAEPSPDGWTIGTLTASMPGRTTLEAKGVLGVGEQFGFRGHMLVAVGQPSGFAAWLARDVDDAVRRLPSAGFSADVELTPRVQKFQGLELILGASKFAGALERRAGSETVRPSMTATLAGDQLDIDGLAAFASLFVSDAGETRFGGHDLDLDLKAGPVRLAGVEADTVDSALRLRDDRLEIDRLSIAGVAGASISATASLEDIGRAPRGDLDISVLAGDLGPLLRLAAERLPDNALLQGVAARATAFPAMMHDAQLDLVVGLTRNGDGTGSVAVSAQGNAGANDVSLTATAGGTGSGLESARLDVVVDVRSSDMAQVLALAGLPASDLGLAGEGTGHLEIGGRLSDGAAFGLSLDSPIASARFDGTATSSADGYALRGAAVLSGTDLEPWLISSGLVLPGMGLGLPVEVKSRVELAAGRIVLGGISGSVAETSVAGDLTATVAGGKPHLEGRLDLGALSVTLPAALVLGEASLQGNGEGWPQVPFAQAPSSPFTASIDLTVGALDGVSDGLAEKLSVKADLNAQGLRLSSLTAEALGGRVEGLVELRNDAGSGLLSANLSLSDVDSALVLGEAAATGKADSTVTLTSSGKSVRGMVSALAGSGTARFRDLALPGLNAAALPALLARADEAGRDIDAATIRAFAPAIVSDGTFSVGEADLAFTVAGGVVRTPPLILEGEGATLSVDSRIDLVADVVQLSGNVVYDAGNEALVGSEPSVGLSISGPWGDARRSFDTGPLAQFLTQRALEREQARVEALQAGLLEKQRLRREVRYYEQRERIRQDEAEAERRRIEEEARLAAEEAVRQAEEEARLKAEEEQRRQAAEEARRRAEPGARPPVGEPRSDASGAAGSAGQAASPPVADTNQGADAMPAAPVAPFEVVPQADSGFNAPSIERLLRSLPERQ